MKRIALRPVYWLLPLSLWSLLVLISFFWNWQKLEQHSLELASSRAQFIFEAVESIRLWNARHGGLYAKVTETTQPNPYLKIKQRDLTSTDGLDLTLLNPAYMTRQLAQVMDEKSQVRIHLTSLKPLNPGNEALPWEKEALQSFEQGQQMYIKLEDLNADAKQVRYMSPLPVEPECMPCHRHQGYKVGDVRGGLSVTFTADDLAKANGMNRNGLIWVHGLVWSLVSGLLLFALYQTRSQMLSLQAAKENLDEQVRQRTAELHTLSKAVEYSPTSTVITDPDGRIQYANPKFCDVTGYSVAEVTGQNPRLLQSGLTDPEIYDQLWETITQGKIWHGELQNRKKDGSLYWERLSISPILDHAGQISHFVALKEDITERKALAEQVLYQANFDYLTALPNRKQFHEQLDRHIELAREHDQTFALLFIDLDGFKSINDDFGHDAGDQLLRESARRIQECVRDSDHLARLGGDEFTLILPRLTDRNSIARIAEAIIKRLDQPFELGSRQGRIAASIGIACFPQDASNADELLKRADHSMYAVKKSGRHNYLFYGD